MSPPETSFEKIIRDSEFVANSVHECRTVAEVKCFWKKQEDTDKHHGVADRRKLKNPAPSKKLTNGASKDRCDMTAIGWS